MNRDLAASVERSQQWDLIKVQRELLKTERELLAEMQDLTTVMLSVNRYLSEIYVVLPRETPSRMKRAKGRAEKARSDLKKKLNRPHLL